MAPATSADVLLALRAADWPVTLLDDLSSERRAAIPAGVPLAVADVGDRGLLAQLLTRQRIRAVLHFADSVPVPEAVRQPLAYHRNNTLNSQCLVEACVAAGTEAL